jgi:hypothetical protein
VTRAHDSFGLLSSPFFFYHALSMRLRDFASSGRIWDRMPWEARLQFLQAVSFTFSGVGFLLDLANPRPGRTLHIVFLVFMGGAIGVAYGFCFMRAPKLLPVVVAVHVVLALVLTPHLGSLAGRESHPLKSSAFSVRRFLSRSVVPWLYRKRVGLG